MVSSGTARRLGFTCLAGLPLTVSLALLQPPVQAQNQIPALPEDTSQTQPDLTDPNNLRPIDPDSGLLSMAGGNRLLSEADSAVSSQNYTLAAKKLQEARQVFNQLSNFYQQLGSSFSGIDNRVYESQRRKAVEAAQLRDRATYQLALVHRAQNQPDLAVPLLIQIVRSQQPTRDLGKKAYQQLLEIGFIDAPDSAPASSSSDRSNSSSSAPKR
ncbi:hypothetical protein [Coleofasciculus sp. FACHB-1120]|uniref:hypothetical protein n=1 Tax=Coleofasciculus sp. FACHB-1120 TaxID=2692783 RepID=UPI001682B3B3|nr:hypothetical protein [Coleofasciculus sp. FACHB-1120]MBD2740901.1 hypothetical protein [Coleofasciculus sp. FACHB-1120]